MPRVLLLLPTATYRAPDFLDAARRQGVEVVIGSEQAQTMAAAMGDRAIVVNLSDPEAALATVLELQDRSPIDGVVAVDDQGVIVAALVAEKLGFPHNPPHAVRATRDKAQLRDALAAADIAQPRFRLVGPGDDVAAIATDVGVPCVVKPLSLSASRGVIRADTPEDAARAAERVRALVECDERLLVESFVPGAEVAVEGLLRGGRLDVLAVFDKPDPLDGPYFEETIYVTPSRHPADVLKAIESTTAAAAKALGLREGPVHAELRIGPAGPDGPGGVVVLELAARSIGGLCSRSLRFGTGTSLEELILLHALGRPAADARREQNAAGVMMLPIPAAGVLQHVGGQDAARAVPGIVELDISILPGRKVEPLPEGDRYLGFLFARGETPDEVEAALREAHRRLDVQITEPT